ncbi:hypothetical protein M569_06906, partial [Genlisea aurea]
LAMDDVGVNPTKEKLSVFDDDATEKHASLSESLLEFSELPSIDKAWTFESKTEDSSRSMFVISQPNLLSNKRKQALLTSHILKHSDSVSFEWAPFPVQITGVSSVVPSPSGSRLLIIRNAEADSPTHIEIWNEAGIEKEFAIPLSIHGSIFTDGWFEGISWNSDETIIAYVAEEPDQAKPTITRFGYKKECSDDKDLGNWKCQGEWEEDWGETYSGKRQPSLFVIDICSGKVSAVEGITKDLSVGQVVWAPSVEGKQQHLVFVGWPSGARKLGIKYCYNRHCALYSVEIPSFATNETVAEKVELKNLTQSISSAMFPRFSPDGKSLIFLSAKCSVDSGAHSATESLHKIEWPSDGKLDNKSFKIIDLVDVVLHPVNDSFPGLYSSKFLVKPWLSDGHTMILSSTWGSTETIISVNTLSGQVSRITPPSSSSSWLLLALDGDNIISVSSSPVDFPSIKYGIISSERKWNWIDVASPTSKCSEKVLSVLSSLDYTVLKVPIKHAFDCLSEGAKLPFEAIYVSSKLKIGNSCAPLIVIIHGGPHSVAVTSFSKSSAFLASLGYNLLIVNYRGSLGFGEEALQSLPGNVGSQDVEDVLSAVDFAIGEGLVDPSKIALLGGSHGGFLTTHLIGQAPDKFAAAAARNPVCNMSLMLGTSDIPDWCFFEAYGRNGKEMFTEAPSADHISLLHSKSPIAHISKVKTPTLFLLGAQDLRVPVSNGLQYARALKERGVETKVIVFPKDVHGIDRPQSDFESFLNIGMWFNKHCK